MKHKISAVLLAVSLFLMTLAISPGAVRASASVSTEGKLPDISELVNPSVDVSSLIPNKFKLLVTLLNYCKENNIPPDSDKLDNFLMFIYHDIDEYADVDGFRESISATWSSLHTAFHPYMIYLEKFYQMGWGAVSTWINEHYNDTLTGIDDKGNVQIPIDDLKQELEKQNKTIDPKNRKMLKYSWRDLSNDQENVDYKCFARNVVSNGDTCVDTDLFNGGIYIQLYMRRNGIMYYAPYQYHMYAENDIRYESDKPVATVHNLYIDPIYYETVNGESLDTFQYCAWSTEDVDFYSDCYLSLGWQLPAGYSARGLFLSYYDKLSSCLKNIDVVGSYWFSGLTSEETAFEGRSSLYESEWNYLLRSDDVSDKKEINRTSGLLHFFYGSRSSPMSTDTPIYSHDTGLYPVGHTLAGRQIDQYNYIACREGCTCDYGFLISAEQFTTTYRFDTARLPVNSTVTISGDSVYDYSITDNSTGETSTIYNYVTNNYTYPENSGGTTSGGSGGGNSGTLGGDITVGGKVDIGGKVDVNVNVNGNGNGVSADMPDLDPVDDYLNSALDESSGLRKFFKEFFDFLPVEIIALLGIGLSVVIIARLLGR